MARSIHNYRDLEDNFYGADLYKSARDANFHSNASDNNLINELNEETGVPKDKIKFFLSTSRELVLPSGPRSSRHLELGGRKKKKTKRRSKKRKPYPKKQSSFSRSR